MTTILVVADEPWVRNEVRAALTDPAYVLIDHTDPFTTAQQAIDSEADAVVVDLQVGSMGGMAVTRAVRHATSDGSDPGMPVVMLLDRQADEFLAKRAGAAGWVTKPFTSYELGEALAAVAGLTGQPTSQ